MIEIFYYITPNGLKGQKHFITFDPKEVAYVTRTEGPNSTTNGWELKIIFKCGHTRTIRHELDHFKNQVKGKEMMVDGQDWSSDEDFSALEERIILGRKAK